jgi:hypothetical protein
MNAEFEKRTREVLEESTTRLDGRTLSRLTQARHAALASRAKPQRQWLRSFVPAGAAAAAAVLAVVMWAPHSGGNLPREAGPVDDMELLADGDAPDFVDENDDPEFYEWAAGEIES